MKAGLLRVSDRLYDDGAAAYGVLPAALIAATLVTGAVDAVSYLALGHIFVANMTGNVVFLGFAVAGAKGLTVWAPCLAIACFAAGAWTETRLARSTGTTAAAGNARNDTADNHHRRLANAVAAHAVFVTVALLIAALEDDAKTATHAQLIAVLAFGFGVQNAVVRKLGVPDLTTTVLTMTVTGLAADPLGKPTVRRLLSLGCIFLGALCGGLLVLHQSISAALGLALVLLIVAAGLARMR